MKVKPWSHSALTQFNNCPKQYFHIKVAKDVKEEEGEAALWGNRVHLAFEEHLRDGKPLDPELTVYQSYLDGIKAIAGTMHVELEMCLNSSLQPCKAFDPGVFVRGYADVVHINGIVARAIDHKTGKRKEGSSQMKLMALLIFAYYPEVQEVRVAFMWLKEGKRDSDRFQRADVARLWEEFLPDLKRFAQAFRTDTWPARQSGLCSGWCAVTQCEFWQPKKPKRANRR